MELRVVNVVAGSETPAGDGLTGALRCVVVLPDGSRRAAVLKRGPREQIVAEIFAALLLRNWGLAVPEPFMINEADSIAFASADDGYPNLKQRLGLDSIPDGPARRAALRIAVELVCNLSNAPLAAACDEAIDNRDRNLGNILWDGKIDGWIDHAFALGGGQGLDDINKLCAMATQVSTTDSFRKAAMNRCVLLDRNEPFAVDQRLSSTPIGNTTHAKFIALRLPHLAQRLSEVFSNSGMSLERRDEVGQ